MRGLNILEIKINCGKCNGTNSKCNKYCHLRAGINLVDFINGVDVVETAIGELREDYRTKEKSLIVCGHCIETYPSPVYLLTGLNTVIDVSGKFRSYNGMTPVQIIKEYIKTLKMSDEGIKKSIETFNKFNSNKLVPNPIKPGMECEIEHGEGENRKISNCIVEQVCWTTNKQSKKLECTVSCLVDKGMLENTGRMIHIPIVEYGTKIRIPSLERTLKSSELDRELIRMAPLGFIKPIVIEDSEYTLALDGKYMYRITNDTACIVGMWKNSTLVSFMNGIESLSKSKAYKKLMNGIKYIDKHRRFMVPYGLFECNKINIS